MNLSNLQKALIGGAVVIVVIGGIFVLGRGKGVKTSPGIPSPTETLVPTIDSSVQVRLTSTSGGHEVLLTIKNIPSGTQSIDYELSYQTKQQGLQGVIGTLTLQNESGYEKRITLGTCSSGKCVYHEVMGAIKLTLKFTGSYGDKIFEKEFTL